jgi:preprotein translocase subunit YajC
MNSQPTQATQQVDAAPPIDPSELPGPLAGVTSMIPYLLIFAVIYVLVVRPSNQQRKAQQDLLQSLQKDDEIITSGGVYGRIVSLEEKIAVVEIAEKVRIRLLRDRIATRLTPPKK